MRVKLGDIFEIGSGGTPSKSHPEYYGGNIPWVKTGDLKNEYLYEVEDFITEEGLNNSSAKMYEEDTVLIAMYGATIGATSILKMKACTNQACAAFRKNEQVIPEYLYYFLRSQKEKFVKDGVGGAQPNISAGYLKKVEMELPSLDEQKVIVDILDKISDVVCKRSFELQSLDDLIKARFVEMFGNPDLNEKEWNIYKMEQLCEVGSSKRIYQNEQSMIGIPFLRISDLVNRMDIGSKECELYIPEERYEELKEQELVPIEGDILLTARGTLGRCYIVQEDDEFYFQDGMITWLSNFDEKITALYISYLFSMPGFRKQIDSLQAGSTVAYLSISMTKKLDIMVPPLELQIQFADFVNQVDKSKVAVQKALDEAQLLFDSLMQKYFG